MLCVRNPNCSALPFHHASGQDFGQGRARVHHESRLFNKSIVLGGNSIWIWSKTLEFHIIWKLPCFPNFFQSFLEKSRTEKSHSLLRKSFGGAQMLVPVSAFLVPSSSSTVRGKSLSKLIEFSEPQQKGNHSFGRTNRKDYKLVIWWILNTGYYFA